MWYRLHRNTQFYSWPPLVQMLSWNVAGFARSKRIRGRKYDVTAWESVLWQPLKSLSLQTVESIQIKSPWFSQKRIINYNILFSQMQHKYEIESLGLICNYKPRFIFHHLSLVYLFFLHAGIWVCSSDSFHSARTSSGWTALRSLLMSSKQRHSPDSLLTAFYSVEVILPGAKV